MKTVEIIDRLKKEAAGIAHGKILLEITIRDYIPRYRIVREESVIVDDFHANKQKETDKGQ
jgi:hypothetical protein